MTVEQLNVIITAQNTEFNRRLDEVNGRLDTMATTAERSANKTYSVFQGLAGKIAALGIGKIIADSITEGMNAIESESLFETSLGEYADNAREWSEKLGNSLGLDDYALRKNVGTLYTMTKSMGVAKDSALSMSQEFSLLAEDMASFYNMSSEEAFTKLKSGLTGETEPLKALGILVDENTVKQYAYKSGIAEVGEELTQTQKVLARYQAIMAQTSTAQGDLARTIDSPANQLRILKNEVKELMRDTGTVLMPTVSSLLGMARSGLELVAPLVNGLAEGVNTVSEAIINSSQPTKTMLTLTLAMALAIPAVTKAQLLMTAAKGAYSALLTILIPKQLTFAAALKATAGWIGIIAAAIGIFSLINDANSAAAATTKDTADAFAAEEAGAKAAADGVDDLANSMDDLGKTATKSLAAVDKLNIFQGVGSGSATGAFVSQNDLDMLGDADGILGDIQEQISEIFSTDIFGGINADSLYNGLKGAWEWLTTDGYGLLKEGIGAVFETGQDVWTVFFGNDTERRQSLTKLNEGVKSFFGADWTNFWQGVGSNVNKALFGTEDERYEAWKALDEQFKGFFGDFGEDWSDFWQGVGAGIQDFAKGDLRGGLNTINSQFEGLFGDLGKDWSNFWQGVGSGFYEFANAGKINENELHSKYSSLIQDIQLATNDYLREGLSAEEALKKAEDDFLKTSEAIYYYQNLAQNARTLADVIEDEKKIDAQMMEYTYVQPSYLTSAAATNYETATRAEWMAAMGQPIINNYTTIVNEIDGEEVASYVISKETRTEEVSNGY